MLLCTFRDWLDFAIGLQRWGFSIRGGLELPLEFTDCCCAVSLPFGVYGSVGHYGWPDWGFTACRLTVAYCMHWRKQVA